MSNHSDNEQLVLAEVQVLLAQLRTQLSILRTGVAIVVSSLTLIFLLFTNQWVLAGEWAWADLPIKIFLGLFAIFGLWRMFVAERKIRRIQKLIRANESKDKTVDDLIV